MCSCTHCSGTALCVLPPNFVYMEYISSPTTLCQKNIESKTPNKFLHQTSFCVFKNLFHSLSLLAAIHLFTRSNTKSKISFSPVKKLVTATAAFAIFYKTIRKLDRKSKKHHPTHIRKKFARNFR